MRASESGMNANTIKMSGSTQQLRLTKINSHFNLLLRRCVDASPPLDMMSSMINCPASPASSTDDDAVLEQASSPSKEYYLRKGNCKQTLFWSLTIAFGKIQTSLQRQPIMTKYVARSKILKNIWPPSCLDEILVLRCIRLCSRV